MAAKNGFILDRDYNFWVKFISGGELDTEALAKSGYTEDQVPYIQGEMVSLGWLGAEDEARKDTAPLEKEED